MWQDFGADRDADCVLLLPTWPIVRTDFWRHQVPALAERYRVITFDGLGNGASDRPTDYLELGESDGQWKILNALWAPADTSRLA